ncbi:MAG: type IIL restriction-modification enzyme MmeI [Bacteroidota bacterium]
MNIAQIYDPDNMPELLREVHCQDDLAVECCFRSNLFEVMKSDWSICLNCTNK